jgi:hypothetical protein
VPDLRIRRVVPDHADVVARAERHFDDIAGLAVLRRAVGVGRGDGERQEHGQGLVAGQG